MPFLPDSDIGALPKARKDPKEPLVQVQLLLSNKECSANPEAKLWKPITLRTWFLDTVLLVTLGLLALVHTLVGISEKQDGLIFTPTASATSMGGTFLYMYLPTIVAVIFSLMWAWLDLDAKRVEPYRQLCRPGGAKSEDSLSLHYPHDFLAMVPLKSLRRKHWPVFFSSCALVLVAWGVIPLQAAIFATKVVTKSIAGNMTISTQYLDTDQQSALVTANYTYSSFGIAWLGELMPPYMSRQAAFAPFEFDSANQSRFDEVWTANTTMYSVDVSCENAIIKSVASHATMSGNTTQLVYASSHGCQIPLPFGPDGLAVVGDNGSKEYTAFHAGNQNHDGYADFYLSAYCPANASHVFMAAFARNRQLSSDAAGLSVTLFCEPVYYQQNATVAIKQSDRSILNVTEYGAKVPMPNDMFNSTQLEWQMNSARQETLVRGAGPPSSKWPDQIEQLSRLPLTLDGNGSYIDTMAGMAIGSYQCPIEDYLDWQVLADSYQAAYRLLFARAMADVLKPDFSRGPTINGTRSYSAQAIYVVPGFAYAVEGLLGAIALLTLALRIITRGKIVNLDSDPGTLTAMMMLVADQKEVLTTLSAQDSSDAKDLARAIEGCTFALERGEDGGSRLRLLDNSNATGNAPSRSTKEELAKSGPTGRLAKEITLAAGVPFTITLLALIGSIAYFWDHGNTYGIALPSQNRFVRQMLENYVPTIIATLVEPVWVVLNRLLCVLQPFQELRNGNATARRSISMNYASLPPQLVAFKALGARHFLLAAVCSMALLANVLAVAFNGMFNEDQVFTPVPVCFSRPYEARFRGDIDGELGPYGSMSKFGAGLAPFYVAMANLTSANPLPAWTDDSAFYLPLSGAVVNNDSASYRGATRAFGVQVDCLDLRGGSASAWNSSTESADILSVANEILQAESGCMLGSAWSIASPRGSELCSDGNLALELVAPLRADDNATTDAQHACRGNFAAGWFRQPASALCGSNTTLEPLHLNTTLLSCRPKLVTQKVEITFDGSGHILVSASVSNTSGNVAQYFDNGPEELLMQSSNFMFPMLGFSPSWHRDSFPSDWNNYIMSLIDPTSRFLDPDSSPPDFNTAAALLSGMYTKLFAVWLSLRHQDLLVLTKDTTSSLTGMAYEQQTRIMVSKPMMILAETILAVFVLTAVALYIRRPGRFLARVPTTISSCIAMFAASRMIEDVRTTGELLDKERFAWLDGPDLKLGYGTFLGSDGRLHIGIERKPFVADLG